MAERVLDEILGWFKPKPRPPRKQTAGGAGILATLPTNNNLSNWVSGGTLSRELQETRARWAQTEAAWQASPFCTRPVDDVVLDLIKSLYEDLERIPATPIMVALCEAAEEILLSEPVGKYEANWAIIEADVEAAVEVREMMTRRLRWCLDCDPYEGHCRSPAPQRVGYRTDLNPSWMTLHCSQTGPQVSLIRIHSNPLTRGIKPSSSSIASSSLCQSVAPPVDRSRSTQYRAVRD